MKKKIPDGFSGAGAADISLTGDRQRKQQQSGIYFGTENGDVCFYDTKKEEARLVTHASGGRIGCMTELDGVLYFATGFTSETLYSYDLVAEMRKEIAEGRIGCVTALNGLVYFGDLGRLRVYNPVTEKQDVISRGISNASFLVGMDELLYFNSHGDLHSYNSVTGEKKLVSEGAFTLECATQLDGVLYFNTRDDIYSYNPATGKRKRAAKTKSTICCMATLRETVYFGGGNYLHSFNLPTMAPKQVAATAGTDSNSSVNWIRCLVEFGGFLYVGDENGNFYSYSPELGLERVAKTNGCIYCAVGIGSQPRK